MTATNQSAVSLTVPIICLAFCSVPHDRLRENAAIDLPLPVELGPRETALWSSLQDEAIFLR